MKFKLFLIVLLILLIGCNQNSKTNYKKESVNSVKNSMNNDSISFINQDTIYRIFEPQELKNYKYNGFSSHQESIIDGYKFLFGYYDDFGATEISRKFVGGQMIVLEENNKLIFSSQGAGDSRNFFPTFYILDKSSPIFILIDLGDECGAWGMDVYKMDKSGVDSVGYLNAACIPKDINADYYSYGIDVTIRKSIDCYYFEFMEDSMLLYPGQSNQKVVMCKDVRYRYNNSEFSLIQK